MILFHKEMKFDESERECIKVSKHIIKMLGTIKVRKE